MLKVMEFYQFLRKVTFILSVNWIFLINSFHTHFNIRQVLEIVVVFMCSNSTYVTYNYWPHFFPCVESVIMRNRFWCYCVFVDYWLDSGGLLTRRDNMAKEIAEEYTSSLADLTLNSKPLINMLTMLADDNIEHAEAIVEAVEKHLEKVIFETFNR